MVQALNEGASWTCTRSAGEEPCFDVQGRYSAALRFTAPAARNASRTRCATRRRSAIRTTRAHPMEGKDDNVYVDPEHLPEKLML